MTAPSDARCLVLRLAGPLQSWGRRSQFNRRETDAQPTKSGIIGMLAAAEGRRRDDPIIDLVRLRFGVRSDQPGSLLRDYHTVSDYRGGPLLSANVNAKGRQKATSPAKSTAVTQRYYLQDAAFVALLEGDPDLLVTLAQAIVDPGFPLALGRRSCVPTQPIVINGDAPGLVLWSGAIDDVISRVPWQASKPYRNQVARRTQHAPTTRLMTTIDDDSSQTAVNDVPVSFAPGRRDFVVRKVRHDWVEVPTDFTAAPRGERSARPHDPFALLGW